MIQLISENKNLVLQENNMQKVCPFNAPLAVIKPSSVQGHNQMDIARMPCGNHCPLFEFDEKFCQVRLHCSKNDYSFPVEFIDKSAFNYQSQEPTGLKIIK